ncbi:MAG: hypothetical protein ACI8UO_006407 [Verrucomicrobiales bacterium]|jgi:hypothetical protein
MKFAIARAFALLILAAFLVAPAHAIPNVVNYQGHVKVDGIGYGGIGQFKFALVDAAGTSYWTNDGTNVGTTLEPTASIAIQVAEGAFSVLLGETPGMTAIPATVFAENDDVHLRIWFDDGTNGSQQLLPDKRIAAVGYAIAANSLSDGALTADMIADGTITSAKLAPGVGVFVQSGGNLSFNGGNVGIGTATPNTMFHVNGAGTFGDGFTPGALSDDAVLNLAVGQSADGASNGIGFFENDGFGMKLGYDGVGTGDDNAIRIYDSSSLPLVSFSNGGGVGIGITLPMAKLDVDGAIRLSDSIAADAEGMVRWSGADFQGYNGTSWLSLTVPASIDGSSIAAGTVTTTQLGAGAVQGSNIASGAVAGAQLAAGAASANLNASGQAGVAAGGMVLSADGANDELEAAGYVKIGGLDTTTAEEWFEGQLNSGSPSARRWHTALWTGSEMIVWGGQGSFSTNKGDGGRYDPLTDSWSAVSATGAPSARHNHTALWTGSEIIVWGGFGGSYLGDGSRYRPPRQLYLYTRP